MAEDNLVIAEDEAEKPIQSSSKPTRVVGIGASAGGLEALERFFTAMPNNSGFAFIVVQHLSPDFKSVMDELLARYTSMPVHLVEEGVTIAADTVYLIPPKKEMVMSDGKLLLTDKDPTKTLSLPINVFLRSLAIDQADRAIAVILSGTGSDGSRGIIDVKEAGGLVIVQDEISAKFNGMPKSALDTGVVDEILAPEAMPEAMLTHAQSPLVDELEKHLSIEGLLEHDHYSIIFKRLREEFNIDFAYYKPSTVNRRIEWRMSFHTTDTLEEYASLLQHDNDEVKALYKDLLIGVTKFFRDTEAFALLEQNVIPNLLQKAAHKGVIRVWIPGCATGEEAYSMAFLFHEQLAKLNSNKNLEVKIFATDLHRESINFAATGKYTKDSLELLTEDRKNRYFEPVGEHFQISAEIRKMIVFAEQNLLKDPPFTKIDLISCRNLLIYFQPIAQKKVISMFLFALNVDGILFLGPSETLGAFENEFYPVNRHWNIFCKCKEIRMPPEVSMPLAALSSRDLLTSQKAHRHQTTDLELSRAYDQLLESHMPPSVLLNKSRQVIHVFGDGVKYVGVPKGRASLDILGMVEGDLRLGLSTGIQRALKEKQDYTLHGIPVKRENKEKQLIDLTVGLRGNENYIIAIFQERTAHKVSIDETQPNHDQDFDSATVSTSRIQDLERELQFSKENLQATIEELETSNEELQASNEELLASNEELQSSNEELQSVNEELFTVNTEYEKKNVELSQLNTDMDHLLHSTEIGTVFIDRKLRIRRYTPAIARTFNLMPQDIGRPLDHITYNLISDIDFQEIVKNVISSSKIFEKEVQDRESSWYLIRICPYLSGGKEANGAVLTLIDISPLKLAQKELLKNTEILRRANQDLENFAYIVSHDLQEPSRTISSYLDLLHQKYENKLDDDAKEFIQYAVSGASNLHQRVDDLLAYSRVQTRGRTFTTIQVENVLAHVREQLADKIAANAASFHYDLSEVEIHADGKQIETLFSCLIDNAIKFKGRNPPEISIRARKQDSDWLFAVNDEGIGINPTDVERVFDIFQRVHSNDDYPGSGMGLAIAKRIVIRHGGTIWLESQPSHGTTFYFILPSA